MSDEQSEGVRRPGAQAQLAQASEALVVGAPFGFAVLDADLRFVHANAAMGQLLHTAPTELAGLQLRAASGELDEQMGGHLRRALASERAIADLELNLRSAGGGQRRYLACCYPVRVEGRTAGVAAAITDVTETHATAPELRAQARQQAGVVALGLRALEGTKTSQLFTDAVRLITDVLAVDLAAVFKREGDELVVRATDPPRPDLVDRLRINGRSGTQAGFTLARREPVVVTDTATERRFAPSTATPDLPVRSSVTLVVPGPRAPYGVLGAYTSTPREFGPDEVRFLQAIANVIGTAAERRRAEQALVRTAQRLELAEDAARMGVWEWNVATGAMVWSDAMKRLFGVDPQTFAGTFAAFLSLVHPDDRAGVERRMHQALAGGGYEAEYRILLGDGQERWTVARGEPLRSEAGPVAGMIGINLDITERKAAEQERVELLTRERSARADAEQARERLSFLASATNALAGSLDEQTTLATLTRLAVPVFADACLVDLLGDDGQLRNVASAHHDPRKQEVLRRLREEVAVARSSGDPRWAVVRGGGSHVVAEVTDDMVRDVAISEQHLDLLEQARGASAVIVALPARGRVVGALTFLRDAHRPTFQPDDVALAEELGRRAALAIDNARLYEETRRTGQRFRRMAETLQSSLLPPLLPAIEGLDLAAKYLPAAEGVAVGGDFYDVFQLGQDRWGVVIGDVQGKGTEAATLTGLARHTVRTAAIREDPVQTLETLNEVIVRDAAGKEDGGRFCTILHGLLEPSTAGATLTLVSGGHPPALVRRADGTVERAGGGGSLIGLFGDIDVHRETVTLRPGDAIVLYTDGVVETRHGPDEFGEGRLVDVLRLAGDVDAATLVTEVRRAVVAFSEGRMRDDIALLVVRVQQP